MIYRREVDGLRAVAVVSVILFHAGFTWIPGGYVGVDVFFVISGYLITTILVTEQMQGRGSLLRFYERRARRILPALFVVLAACLPLAWHLMLPYQFKDFAKSVLAVLTFSSNILFWRESGYFAAATELKPLLHTWSLAIEEQFYVVLPLVIMAVWRFGLRPLTALLVIVATASLGLAEWASFKGIVVANFYLMPTRAWELLIGALVGIWLLQRPAPVGRAAAAASVLGLGLILYGVFRFDRSTPFPGLLALVPTLGTALVILCGSAPGGARRLLSLRPVVAIGLISYSAYLWHQPLYAFARLAKPEPSQRQLLFCGLIVATLVLGWLT